MQVSKQLKFILFNYMKSLIQMQIKNKLFSTALALSALIFVGCQKQDFVALNTNPDVLYSVKARRTILQRRKTRPWF